SHYPRYGRHAKNESLMIEQPAQSAFVQIAKPNPEILRAAIEFAGVLSILLLFGAQKFRAHHGRERERNERRDCDRHTHGDREFAKQTADYSGHKQKRNENGDERDAQGHDGKTNSLHT